MARNTGIEGADFPFIALLDADDWWAPDFLEVLYNETKNNPEFFIFSSGRSRVFDTNTERFTGRTLPPDGESGVVNYFEVIQHDLPPINSSNTLFRKEVFEGKMFQKGQEMHEDHDLWLRICMDKEIVFVNRPLSFYLKTNMEEKKGIMYQASDFAMYLETLSDVRLAVSDKNRRLLKRYMRRFIVLTYLKYGYRYSKSERKMVLEKLKHLIPSLDFRFLQAVNLLPFDVYPILKTF